MYYYMHPSYYHSGYEAYMRANGQQTELLEALLRAMEGESRAIDFYERLRKTAPSRMAQEKVEHVLEDERLHLEMFVDLYRALSGKSPKYRTRKKQISGFKEGIREAFEDEIEAYEFYRDNYLLTQDGRVRDVFFHAMTDEMEHATRFGFMYRDL
ncbi:ferritin family protein [Virgibacillus xinjiangensis]|uniref:Ferritin family protein n=1 Tax=Virgibacillus xinjiangensis TaxID=393090 RepID=A0ABV7CYQ3_9BACI